MDKNTGKPKLSSNDIEVIVAGCLAIFFYLFCFIIPFISNEKYNTISAALIRMDSKVVVVFFLALFVVFTQRLFELTGLLEDPIYNWTLTFVLFTDSLMLLLLGFVYDTYTYPKIHYTLFVLVLLFSCALILIIGIWVLQQNNWHFNTTSITLITFSIITFLLMLGALCMINIQSINSKYEWMMPSAEFFYLILMISSILMVIYQHFN